MTDAVVAEGLVKRYGAVTALDGLSLAVPEGTLASEILGIGQIEDNCLG